MDSIDESKRKPRRTRGTPSYYYRNRFAFAVIAAGTALFTAFAFTPVFKKANAKLLELIAPTEEEIDRRYLFSLPTPRTSRAIKETIEEKEKLFSER